MIKTHRISLLLIGGFALFWLLFALFRIESGTQSRFESIQNRGVIRLCGEDPEPFELHRRLGEAFAERHHLKLVYITVEDAKQARRQLQSGACDILVSPLPMHAQKNTRITYTQPIYKSRLYLAQKDAGVKDPLHLEQCTLTLTNHSPYALNIRHLSEEINRSIHIHYASHMKRVNILEGVQTGRYDFSVVDEPQIPYFQALYPELDFNTAISFDQLHAWGIPSENSALLDSVNVFLDEMKNSPAYARLLNDYGLKP